ncbi:hypothetical protein [Vibrio cincinnatiensis]|uniref:hypothetical protein n=1 Tax=Vibrio cincinnatiensis TaxID=675 RepID=UPI001EE0D3CE|nr:hypothetical protein [Vibrio cincinnatiensis]MCG3731114.1 hypothetical protein [Vibrio cincinnatiensis]
MEQLERVERYLERLRAIYAGETRISWESRKYHEDDVHSFFLHCHHLQDWVEELNQIGIRKEDISKFIKSYTVLRICTDLANSTKHCKLKHQKVTGYKHQPSISGAQHQENMFGNGVKSKFSLISGYACYDALEVAEECFRLWKSFIESHIKVRT